MLWGPEYLCGLTLILIAQQAADMRSADIGQLPGERHLSALGSDSAVQAALTGTICRHARSLFRLDAVQRHADGVGSIESVRLPMACALTCIKTPA